MKNKKLVICLIAISAIIAGITLSVTAKQNVSNKPTTRNVYIGQNSPSCISGTVSGILKLQYSIALSSREIAMENHTKKLFIDRSFNSNSTKMSNMICNQETGLCMMIQGVYLYNFNVDSTTLENGLHELKILNSDGSVFTSMIVFVQN